MLKQRLLKILSAAICFSCLAASVFAIDIYYKNKIVPTDTEPVIENGRTLVPVSVIAQSMGAKVSWDAATRTAVIEKDNVKVEMTLGSSNVSITKDGQKSNQTLDVPAKSINGRTMVPVRAISEIFGSNVDWDKNTSSILIDSDKPKYTPSENPTNIVPSGNLEKSISERLNGHRALYSGAQLGSGLQVQIDEDDDLEMTKIPMALLNERVPGNYKAFSMIKANGEAVVSGFIDTATNKIYLQSSNIIFSIPDYNVIVPPFKYDIYSDIDYDVFAKSIALRDKAISVNDDVKFKYENVNEEKQTMDISIINNNKAVARYAIDRYASKVTNLDTKKVVYDDSAAQNLKETFINEDTAKDMAISILQKLKKIPAGKNYTITDLKATDGNESTELRPGFFFKLQVDGKDAGSFFINTTSTVMMELDKASNKYYYIFGAFTPFG